MHSYSDLHLLWRNVERFNYKMFELSETSAAEDLWHPQNGFSQVVHVCVQDVCLKRRGRQKGLHAETEG